MTKYLSKPAISLFFFLLLASCGTNYNPLSHGFKKELVKGGEFWITTYQRISNEKQPYVFYIEGDGAAFAGRYRVSTNPTPRRQMLIELAGMDTRPNVVYVARLCQYTPMALNPKCSLPYWTDKRMSDDSVEAINDVINSINKSGKKFSLIGFSGGGAIAILVAERNPMVKNIITIAGNLDHTEFTKHHNVSPMTGSLNPIDYTSSVKHIPQIHMSGNEDNIVPSYIADKFTNKASSICVKKELYPNVSHLDGWNKIWEDIHSKPINCNP